MTIADETYASLSRFTLANGERIPRLDDVLALATHRATVYVEIKGAAIEEQVVACLRRHPDTDTAVHSFDHRIPLKVGRLAPETPLGLLSASYLLNVGQTLRAAGARDLWQHSSLIDEDLVAEVHAFGGRVIAWTENDFTRAAALVQMRVNAICTDIPGPMRQALAGLGLVSSVVAPREA